MRRLALAAALSAGLAAWAASTELVEVSAPLLPDVGVLYAAEGAGFPATLAGEQALAHRAALTFPALLASCATAYPTITPAPDGGAPLSSQALTANYEAVARCAYEQHTAKPYWIPRLVDDVDLCAVELGAGWRLPTEADVDAFTEAELEGLAAALAPAQGSSSFGSFYFSLRLYVRGADGTLRQGDLTPGAAGPRVTPLPYQPAQCGGGDCATHHLEAGLALRCLRRT